MKNIMLFSKNHNVTIIESIKSSLSNKQVSSVGNADLKIEKKGLPVNLVIIIVSYFELIAWILSEINEFS